MPAQRAAPTDTGADRPGNRWLLATLVLTAFVAGVAVRFWDLGGAPLAVDEYYLATSILNVAERGLPEFACGGYYSRGVLLQYLSLPLLALGASLELAVRFWPAVAGCLAIIAVWRIGLLAGGTIVASLAVVLTSLSLWEVEFARFGRMYAPFQAIFLWYVYFQVQHVIRGRESAGWWCLGLSAIAVFVYESAVLLLALNFLSALWPNRRRATHLATAATLLVGGVLYLTRRLGGSVPSTVEVPAPAAAELAAPAGLPLSLPEMPGTVGPILAAGLLLTGWLLWRHRTALRATSPAIVLWIPAVASCGFGLIGLGVGLGAAGLLLNLPSPVSLTRPRRRSQIGWLAVLLTFWLAVVSCTFLLDGAGAITSIRKALRYTLDYPDVYFKIVRPWRRTIPATTVLLGTAMLWSLRTALVSSHDLERNEAETLRFLFAVLILMALGTALLWQPYAITRYTYYLYPLILVLSSAGIAALAGKLRSGLAIVAACIAGLFLIAEDFRLDHLVRINDPEIRYRTEYGPLLGAHYYLRLDYRGAAAYVNERLLPNESVVAFDLPLPHYLRWTSAIFIRKGTDVHARVASCGGTRERWSNAPLLARDEEMYGLIDRAQGDVWLVMRTAAFKHRDPLESSLPQRYGVTPKFTSQDGHLAVFRISKTRRSIPPRAQAIQPPTTRPETSIRDRPSIGLAAMPAQLSQTQGICPQVPNAPGASNEM